MRARTRPDHISQSFAIRDAATLNTSHADTNCTASGPHFPQREWHTANHKIRHHKGIRVDRDTSAPRWQPDTAPLDYLIGDWDPATGKRGAGGGYHAIADLAWHADPSLTLRPSITNKPCEGGPEIIDYLLVNARGNGKVCAEGWSYSGGGWHSIGLPCVTIG